MQNSIKAISDGLTYLKYYQVILIKALLIPFLLLIVLISLALLPNIDSKIEYAIYFLQWIPFTLIAITTHKVILEGPNAVPTWGINRFGARELKFVGYQILIVFVALPVAVLVLIPHIGIYLWVFAIMYIIGRLSLVFPSIAIGADLGFVESWSATKNHQLMMIVVVGMFPLILGFLEDFLASLPGFYWVSAVISALTIVLVIAPLSAAYKIVMEPKLAR